MALIPGIVSYSLDLLDNEGLGAPPIWDSVWCSPAGAFLFLRTNNKQNRYVAAKIFCKMNPIFY